MKKKMTLQKATVAAGVVAMSVGLFNSFSAEANGGSGGGCEEEICTEGGIITVTVCDRGTNWWGSLMGTPCNVDSPGETCQFTNTCGPGGG